MSENRQKYSSSPLYGLKHSRSSGGGFQVPPEHRPRQPRQRTFVGLQVIMSLLLPALFVIALILRYTELHWAFLALAALAVLGILALALRKRKCGPWLRRAALVPAAYLLGELLVLGVNTVSYSLARDFALILVTALFLYPALLLADVIRTERQRRKLPETL